MNRSTFTFVTACVTGLVLSCSAQAQMVSRNQIIDALTAPAPQFSKLGPSRSLTLDNNSSGNSNSNYVVAHPGTTSSDILQLVDHVRARVKERTGATLERELHVW